MCKLWIRRNDEWVTPKNVWIRKSGAWKKVNSISIRTPQDTWCKGFDGTGATTPGYDIGEHTYSWTNSNGYWNTSQDFYCGTNEYGTTGEYNTEGVTSIDTIDSLYVYVKTNAGPIGFDPLIQTINPSISLVGQVTTTPLGVKIPVSPGMHSMIYSANGFNIPTTQSDAGVLGSGSGVVGRGFCWSPYDETVWNKHLGAIIPDLPYYSQLGDTPFAGIGDTGFRGTVDFKIGAWWGQQVPTNGDLTAQIMCFAHKPTDYNTLQYMFGQTGISVNKAIPYAEYPDPETYTRVKSSPTSEGQVTVLGTIRITVYSKPVGYGVTYQIFAP